MSRQADNTVTFSFDGPQKIDLNAIQGAIEAEAGAVAEPTEEVKVEAAVEVEEQITQEEEQETVETAVAAPQTKEQSQTTEVKTHKIVVDGQELEVTEDDLKSGHMRHRDYTQKTQRLSSREKELDARERQWQQEIQARDEQLAKIDQFLQNQAAVDAYRERAFGRQAPPQMPVVDPSTPLTAEQVAEIARYNAEQVRLQNQRELQMLRYEQEQSRKQADERLNAVQREKLEVEVNKHITSLLDQYPVLKKYEDIEDDLMADAAKRGVRDLESAKQQLSAAAERRVATIKAIVEAEKKQAAIKAAEIKRKSTEPPGGTPPPRPAAKKLTLNPKDAKALRAAAEEDLKAFLGKE